MRGWRKERVLRTTDTVGRQITVTTGLTTDNAGADVVGLAIDGGPSAVVALDRGARLVANLRSSLSDLHTHLAENDTPPGRCVMTVIAGELPAAEVEHTLYAVHFWARDTRNHRYDRDQLADPIRDFLEPQCSQARFTIPARYAFRDELSQELGEDRDTSRDCRSCFSPRRR